MARIAQDLYETERRHSPGFWLPWKSMAPNVHEAYAATVRELLHRDVIRVGRRPTAERALEGQTTIDDFDDERR